MLGQDPRRERQQRTEAGETAVWQAEVLDAQSVAPATEWEPTAATLEDTYPPAAGILLQKLSEFCQKDVPRSFTLQEMGKEGCAEQRILYLTMSPTSQT